MVANGGGQESIMGGGMRKFQARTGKENARRAKQHMGESDSSDSSMGYSTSDSEGDQNFPESRQSKRHVSAPRESLRKKGGGLRSQSEPLFRMITKGLRLALVEKKFRRTTVVSSSRKFIPTR